MSTPIYRTVRRTWRERLFSRPWHPLQATREERDLAAEAAQDWQEWQQQHCQIRAQTSIARQQDLYARRLRFAAKGQAATVASPPPPASSDSYLMTASMLGLMNETAAPSPRDHFASGGGGDFGGGGASGSWESPAPSPSYDSPAPSPSSDSYSSSSDSGSSSSSID